MLDRDQANDIFDKLRRQSQADEIELLISGGRSALTRFANNTIHQNVAEEAYHISVRSAFGNRTARASTNKHDDDSLRRVVQSSEALARVQHPDPDLLPMPTKEEVAAAASADCGDGAVNRYFEATARLTPQDRAQGVAAVVDVAKKHNLAAAGIFSSAEIVEGIFNSKGVNAWYEQTLAEVSVSMIGSSSSGWQKANSPDRARLDPVRMAEVAAIKAIESKDPRDLPPGKYTVILEPAAVLDIVGFMFWDFGGSALLEQRSFLNDRIATQLFGENITIWDDVYHPLQAGVPFDGEGMRRQRLKLIENGVVRAIAYSRCSAKRMQASEMAAKVGLGRRVSPVAGRSSFRRRRDEKTTVKTDREWCRPCHSLLALKCKANASVGDGRQGWAGATHRPWLCPAQRDRRSPAQYRVRQPAGRRSEEHT